MNTRVLTNAMLLWPLIQPVFQRSSSAAEAVGTLARLTKTVGSRVVRADTLASVTDDVHWVGVATPADTLVIRGLLGDITAEPSTGQNIEVTAHRRSDTADAKSVPIVHERSAHRTTFCPVYPVPGITDCDSYAGELKEIKCTAVCKDVRVDWIVRVPAHAHLVLQSLQGEIRATQLTGDVDAKTVSGNIDVATAGHVRAWTMGSVRAAMGSTDWSQALTLYAGRDLTVVLPAGANTRVIAHSQFGRGHAVPALPDTVHTQYGIETSGALGSGGRVLRLESLSGDITLRIGTQ